MKNYMSFVLLVAFMLVAPTAAYKLSDEEKLYEPFIMDTWETMEETTEKNSFDTLPNLSEQNPVETPEIPFPDIDQVMDSEEHDSVNIDHAEETNKTENTVFQIKIYDTDNDEVITMDLEEYVCFCMAAEVPSKFHTEALKAQAVAIRTYAVYNLGKHQEQGADLCTDYSHCCGYLPYDEACEAWTEGYTDTVFSKLKTAVEATKGEILTYEGEPICAMFHAKSYLKTESCEALFGNVLPYLVSVDSPEYEDTDILSYVEVTEEEYEKITNCGNFEQTTIVYGESGRVQSIYTGNRTFSGNQFRTMFSLKSANFSISCINEKVIFTVYGWGHGVGLSQYGAESYAQSGKDYSWILAHYYTGVNIVEIE